MMDRLYLIAHIAGTPVAIPSSTIDSVVVPAKIIPVPQAPHHLIGLFAVRSRVVTLIDTRLAVGEAALDDPEGRKTIVVEQAGHAYGLAVDQVEDVVFLDTAEQAVRGNLAPQWQRITTATILHEGKTHLVVSPAALIGGDRAKAA